MPKLTVDGVGTFDVPPGKRLVNALIDEAKIDQLHACGGIARCTTCRVEFVSGEPTTTTQAEHDVLTQRVLISVARFQSVWIAPCRHTRPAAGSAAGGRKVVSRWSIR